MLSWRLNDSNFTYFDRLRICLFFLNPKNFWTLSNNTSQFEEKMSEVVGCNYSVFVSSGSAANTILAMRLKDLNFDKKTIIFPSTTWITSVSPFIREGFTPEFIDVSMKDFCLDLDILEERLKASSDDVACIFITSLIGFVPDIDRLFEISEKYNVKVMMDNCENTFGTFNGKNISSFFTSTTSTYFGHQLQSVEGGFIFTNSEQERDYFLMARNHGMTRGIENQHKYMNPDVDPRFDFFMLANNFRNTDINAFIGILDLKRINKIIQCRQEIYKFFIDNLKAHDLPKISKKFNHCPFSLPIITENSTKKQKALDFCSKNSIETRPFVSGNLLRQTSLKKFADFKIFKNSNHLQDSCFYVGLHPKVELKKVYSLTRFLNTL